VKPKALLKVRRTDSLTSVLRTQHSVLTLRDLHPASTAAVNNSRIIKYGLTAGCPAVRIKHPIGFPPKK
jgi:hypothetical protein